MENSELKKKLLKGLMGSMDDMASKRFKKGGAAVVEVEVEKKPDNPLREAASKIYDIITGNNPAMIKSPEPSEPPDSPEEAERRAMQEKIDVERKASEQKIKDMKMDKLIEALGAFIDAYRG